MDGGDRRGQIAIDKRNAKLFPVDVENMSVAGHQHRDPFSRRFTKNSAIIVLFVWQQTPIAKQPGKTFRQVSIKIVELEWENFPRKKLVQRLEGSRPFPGIAAIRKIN